MNNQYLSEVRKIVLNGLEAYDVSVYLFGSCVTGKEKRTSDIDVAVLPKAVLPSWVLSEIRSSLEESNVPYRVDLVDLSTSSPIFRDRVIQEGLLWSGSKNG